MAAQWSYMRFLSRLRQDRTPPLYLQYELRGGGVGLPYYEDLYDYGCFGMYQPPGTYKHVEMEFSTCLFKLVQDYPYDFTDMIFCGSKHHTKLGLCHRAKLNMSSCCQEVHVVCVGLYTFIFTVLSVLYACYHSLFTVTKTLSHACFEVSP